jgi:quinoprotein glucose dehydrogenase
MKWGFQLVHHDLWDYDTAAPPLLAAIPHRGQQVPVVIAGNKSGFLYVLNRDTGVPVFGVEERPVPQSTAEGEASSPTQPFPLAPPPLARQSVTPEDAWGPTEEARTWCRNWLANHKTAMFTPPSTDETLIIPGFIGGMNWSGYALDPSRNLLIVPTNHLPFRMRLIPADEWDETMRHREPGWEYNRMRGAPYGMMRRAFFSPAGLPCVAPPWGMLNAVNLATGKIAWQVPLGSIAEFTKGDPNTPPGSINTGGAIVTAGGLVFVAGTIDKRIRAFDIETGKELWNAELPASAHAMPMTYSIAGKQYVVIAAGGSAKIEEEAQGDAVVAFALQ